MGKDDVGLDQAPVGCERAGEWYQPRWSCACVGMTASLSGCILPSLLLLGMEQAGTDSINCWCLLRNWLLFRGKKKAISACTWQQLAYKPVNLRCKQAVALAAKPSGISGLMFRSLQSKALGAFHVFIYSHLFLCLNYCCFGWKSGT